LSLFLYTLYCLLRLFFPHVFYRSKNYHRFLRYIILVQLILLDVFSSLIFSHSLFKCFFLFVFALPCISKVNETARFFSAF